jgi:hypothetical protein
MATIVCTAQALAVAPGQIAIAAPRQAIALRTGSVAAGGIEVGTTKVFDVSGAATQLPVRPLPSPPGDFAGAVGHFTLESSLDKANARVGDAVKWRLTMKGRGNWPMLRGLPSRLLARDFDIMGPAETAEAGGGSLFEREASETLLVAPRRAGRFTLGPVEMSVFDPETGRYVRVTAPAVILDVAAVPGAATTPPRADPPPEPRLPAPLAGAVPVLTPFSNNTRVALVVVPLLALLLLWLGLAFGHARLGDAGRPLRRAHRRLAAALDAIEAAPDSNTRKRGLREWQRQIAVRHALGAAPVASAFTTDAATANLWSEADLALYGRAGDIVGDWAARARAQWLAMSPPPAFRPLAFMDRAHLWPRLAPLVLAFIAVPALAGVLANPRDWHGHYNRALALAQADASPAARSEAAVEAAAAWVQAPRAAQTRALWRQLGSRAVLVPADEGGLPGSSASDPAGPAWWLSPPGWQRLVALASGLALAGAALMLLARFDKIGRRWWRNGGLLTAMAGGIAGLTATALTVQGPLAEPRAILMAREVSLYTLPVEDPAETGRSSVRAGTVARTEKRFLGWSGVVLADGRSGWVRTAATVALWEPAPLPATGLPIASATQG